MAYKSSKLIREKQKQILKDLRQRTGLNRNMNYLEHVREAYNREQSPTLRRFLEGKKDEFTKEDLRKVYQC